MKLESLALLITLALPAVCGRPITWGCPVIEDASANRNKSTADAVSSSTRVLLLSTRATADGLNYMAGFTHGRTYLTTNGAGAFLDLAAPATKSV